MLIWKYFSYLPQYVWKIYRCIYLSRDQWSAVTHGWSRLNINDQTWLTANRTDLSVTADRKHLLVTADRRHFSVTADRKHFVITNVAMSELGLIIPTRVEVPKRRRRS